MWSVADKSYPTYSFSDYDKIALKKMYPNPFYLSTPEQYLINDVTDIRINTIDQQRFPIESVNWTIETNNVEVEVLSSTNSNNLTFKATQDVLMAGGTITFTCTIVSGGQTKSMTITREVLINYFPVYNCIKLSDNRPLGVDNHLLYQVIYAWLLQKSGNYIPRFRYTVDRNNFTITFMPVPYGAGYHDLRGFIEYTQILMPELRNLIYSSFSIDFLFSYGGL